MAFMSAALSLKTDHTSKRVKTEDAGTLDFMFLPSSRMKVALLQLLDLIQKLDLWTQMRDLHFAGARLLLRLSWNIWIQWLMHNQGES